MLSWTKKTNMRISSIKITILHILFEIPFMNQAVAKWYLAMGIYYFPSPLNSRLSDHQESDFCISIKIIITWPLHEIWGTIIVWWAINTIEGRKDYYESNSNSAFAKCRSGPWWCYSAVCISTNNSFKSTNWLILYINNLYLFAVH